MPFRLTALLPFCLACLAAAWPAPQRPAPRPAAPPDTAVYREPYRPQYHFTPPRNWINDPNGLVYYQGEYHLFYQYNPFGNEWGHMSWGHAVSRDLLHWRHLPVAIPEDPSGFMIFSGCVVVDNLNTSGLGTARNASDPACLVAVYTADFGKLKRQAQHLAYSNDRGRTWTQYKHNPVLDLDMADFRDPNVIRHGDQWIMSVVLPKEHKVRLYASRNLRDWTHLSDFGPAGKTDEIWECPALYPLPVSNRPGLQKWVLQLSTQHSMQYFVGEFDGSTFRNDNPDTLVLPYDAGPDMYAAIPFAHTPGRTVALGWMSSWRYAGTVPTHPWRGAMTIPREHTLKAYPEGIRLVQRPVPELDELGTTALSLRNVTLAGANAKLRGLKTKSAEVLLELDVPPGAEAGLLVRMGVAEHTRIGYRAGEEKLFLDRTQSGRVDFSGQFARRYETSFSCAGRLKLRILLDWSSVEVFAGDGQQTLTAQVFPQPGSTGLQLYTANGTATVRRLTVRQLPSVWPRRGDDE